MEEREFYEWVELWFGLMRFGFVANFALLQDGFSQMEERQRELAADYAKSMEYGRFLLTPYWYAIRLELFRLGRGRCRGCTERLQLDRFEVHHTSYKHHGSEHAFLDDLKVLCFRCHALITEAVESARAQTTTGAQ